MVWVDEPFSNAQGFIILPTCDRAEMTRRCLDVCRLRLTPILKSLWSMTVRATAHPPCSKTSPLSMRSSPYSCSPTLPIVARISVEIVAWRVER